MLFLFAGVFLARRYLAVIFQCRKVRVWHMSGRGGMRRQKAGEVSPFNVRLAWPAVGSSHLGLFFPSKGTQTCGRRVPPTAFWCRQTPGHLEGIPRLPRAPSFFWVSPWRPLPPCGAAAGASSTCRGRPGSASRPLPLRPPPPAPPCWVRRLRQAPPILSSRSRRQSLEKWNLAAAAPCAGLAEPHWACSVAGASAALSRKLACCSPQLIPALSGLRDPGAGADRALHSTGEPRFPPCLPSGD